MPRILITGARGMLGSALVRFLQKKKKEKIELFPCDLEDLDVTNPGGVRSGIGDIKPHIVIHAAAFTDVDGCEVDEKKAMSVNAEGTKSVAQACAEVGARLIYISTDFVFDGTKRSPYSEADSPNPVNVYGQSKLRGEEYVSGILLDFLIVRTSWLFGPGGRNFVDTIRCLADSRKTLSVVTDQVGSPTFSEDLTEALWLLADSEAGGIVHVSNEGACSRYEWARKIVEFSEKNPAMVRPSTSQEVIRPARRPSYSVLNSSRFKEITGRSLRPWVDAVEAYLSSSLSPGGRGQG
ncbi:MAG: dTDP-4-dehydrorhamnose reductase [Candidatus Tectomicrobia bacterium]|uniref:dTDP-4-dehydrorhamnose reductase n=1 Tax=Tectimicrobiota bacterium TaxID=2528274 RepID=A0A932LYH8_UNCTE|nr:dTDP-4-dehydrorhamnose reductase [Candidatus Tectomicrobia bacterium]